MNLLKRALDLAERFFDNEAGSMRVIMGMLATVLLVIAVTLLFITVKVTAG